MSSDLSLDRPRYVPNAVRSYLEKSDSEARKQVLLSPAKTYPPQPEKPQNHENTRGNEQEDESSNKQSPKRHRIPSTSQDDEPRKKKHKNSNNNGAKQTITIRHNLLLKKKPPNKERTPKKPLEVTMAAQEEQPKTQVLEQKPKTQVPEEEAREEPEEIEREKVLEELPEVYKKRWGEIAFAPWKKIWRPVVILSPYSVSSNTKMRRDWMKMFADTKDHRDSMWFLGYWLGDENGTAFTYTPAKDILDYEEGIKKGYNKLPRYIQKKKEAKKHLNDHDLTHVRAIEMLPHEVAKPPQERIPFDVLEKHQLLEQHGRGVNSKDTGRNKSNKVDNKTSLSDGGSEPEAPANDDVKEPKVFESCEGGKPKVPTNEGDCGDRQETPKNYNDGEKLDVPEKHDGGEQPEVSGNDENDEAKNHKDSMQGGDVVETSLEMKTQQLLDDPDNSGGEEETPQGEPMDEAVCGSSSASRSPTKGGKADVEEVPRTETNQDKSEGIDKNKSQDLVQEKNVPTETPEAETEQPPKCSGGSEKTTSGVVGRTEEIPPKCTEKKSSGDSQVNERGESVTASRSKQKKKKNVQQTTAKKSSPNLTGPSLQDKYNEEDLVALNARRELLDQACEELRCYVSDFSRSCQRLMPRAFQKMQLRRTTTKANRIFLSKQAAFRLVDKIHADPVSRLGQLAEAASSMQNESSSWDDATPSSRRSGFTSKPSPSTTSRTNSEAAAAAPLAEQLSFGGKDDDDDLIVLREELAKDCKKLLHVTEEFIESQERGGRLAIQRSKIIVQAEEVLAMKDLVVSMLDRCTP